MSLRSLVLTSFAALAVSVSARATTFDMTSFIGKTPTFSITSGGVTATFTSPANPGFGVQDTTGLLNFNTALLDANGNDPLTISFSTPISGTIVIPFAIEDAFGFFSSPDSLTITANTGQTASFLGVPDTLLLQNPEGIATFSLTSPVTSLTLTATNDFAIGNVSTVASTPEPTSLVLLATGMAGLLMKRRRG